MILRFASPSAAASYLSLVAVLTCAISVTSAAELDDGVHGIKAHVEPFLHTQIQTTRTLFDRKPLHLAIVPSIPSAKPWTQNTAVARAGEQPRQRKVATVGRRPDTCT